MEVLMDEVLTRIKTPLSDILQSIPAVRDDANTIVRLEESCFEMLTVINNAIDFLNLLNGRLQIVSESVSCNDLVTESSGFVEKILNVRGLQWSVNISDAVPSAILGDYHRIQQVFVHFIRTAIIHTKKGAIVTEIIRDGEYYIFSIQNTGRGLSDATQKTLDEILSLATISDTKSYNLMGFSICHFLCRLMGGKIWYKSAPDLGTKFWFSVRCRE